MNKAPVIGMILKGFPRISETFITNEIRLLEELGFSIVIISMRRPREYFTHASVKQIKAPVVYLPSELKGNIARLLWANLNVAVRSPKNYARALRMAWKKLGKSRAMATLKHLLQAGYLAHYALPGRKVERLHAHFAHSPTSVAQFAHVITGLPFGFTGHAKDIYTQREQALRDKLNSANLVITCTEYNRRHLKALSNGGARVHRVYHGIDTSLFAYRGVQHAKSDRYELLCVARMVEKKGISVILQALFLLRERGLDCSLRHVGDGPLKEQLQKKAEELGLSEHVRWLGTMAHEQVLEEYARADAFVLACLIAANGDRDGIPNVLAESMAVGVPLVATRVSGIPELVRNDETGLLVAPENPEALAYALERVLLDKDLRIRIIPAARQRVLDVFDNRQCARELARVYQNA